MAQEYDTIGKDILNESISEGDKNGLHQPNLEEPAEFRGWSRDDSGEIVEMTSDTPRTLLSEKLNLLFKWNIDMDLNVRLLRPYFPDGAPITTSIEESVLRKEAQQQRDEEKQLREEAEQQREIAEAQVAEQAELIQEQAAELERLRQQIGK